MSFNRGMDKEAVVHRYNGVFLSHRKERNNVTLSNVDGPRGCHAEGSQTNTVCYYCLYVGFKEMLQVYKFTAHVEDKLVVTRRKVMGVTNWEIGIGIYALLYTE